MKWCPYCKFWRITTTQKYKYQDSDIYSKEIVCNKCHQTISMETYKKVLDKKLLLKKMDAVLALIDKKLAENKK